MAQAATTIAPGSTDLAAMLRSLEPSVDPEVYVWCTFPPGSTVPAGLPIKLRFEELEGTTIVTTDDAAAKAGIEKRFFPSKMVTITVHSSLEAVGLLAAITTQLAREVGVGVNPVSAFHHDHLFVPLGKEDEVVQSLKRLAERNATGVQAEGP